MPPRTAEPTDSMNYLQRSLEMQNTVYDGREFQAPVPQSPEVTQYEAVYSQHPDLQRQQIDAIGSNAHEFAIPTDVYAETASRPATAQPETQQPEMLYFSDQDAISEIGNAGLAVENCREAYELAA